MDETDAHRRSYSEFKVRALSAKFNGVPSEAELMDELRRLYESGNIFARKAVDDSLRVGGSGSMGNPVHALAEVHLPGGFRPPFLYPKIQQSQTESDMRETEILRGLHKARANCFAGGMVPSQPAQKPVPATSLRGLGRMIASGYDRAVAGTSELMERAATPKPKAPAQAPVAVPTPTPAPEPRGVFAGLDGAGGKGLKRREAEAGLRNGVAKLEGPGTSTSDSIPARLSKGEAVLPAKTVNAVGADKIAALIELTNGAPPAQGLRAGGGYADGLTPEDIERARKATNARYGWQGAAPAAAPPAGAPTGASNPLGAAADEIKFDRVRPQPSAAPQPTTMADKARGAASGAAQAVKGVFSSGPKPPAPTPLMQREVSDLARSRAKKVGSGLKAGVTSGFIPGAAIEAAQRSYDTSTDEFSNRTGIETDGSVVDDLVVRGVGTMQNVGNGITLGLTDRIGNALAGNGFGHSSAYGGSGFLGDLLDNFVGDNPRPTATQPAAAQPAAQGEHQTLSPTGAGAGRGLVTPTPNPNTPPVQPQNAVDLFTNKAAASLRDGRDTLAWAAPNTVYKTVDPKTGVTTYSGRDVGEGASWVNGKGEQVTPRGGVSSAQGLGAGYTGAADRAVSGALQAAAARGDWDAVKSYYQRNGGTFNGSTAEQDAAMQPAGYSVVGGNAFGDVDNILQRKAAYKAAQMRNNAAQVDAYRQSLSDARYRHDTPSGDAVLNYLARQNERSEARAAAQREARAQGGAAMDKLFDNDPYSVVRKPDGTSSVDPYKRNALYDYASRSGRKVQVGDRVMDLAEAAHSHPQEAKKALSALSGELMLKDLANELSGNMFFDPKAQAGDLELAEPIRGVNLTDYEKGVGLGRGLKEKFFGEGVVTIKGANGKPVSLRLDEIADHPHAAQMFQALNEANERFKKARSTAQTR